MNPFVGHNVWSSVKEVCVEVEVCVMMLPNVLSAISAMFKNERFIDCADSCQSISLALECLMFVCMNQIL